MENICKAQGKLFVRLTLKLENKRIPIHAWDSGCVKGFPLVPICIKVRGFSMVNWHSYQFKKILDDYGAVLLVLTH